MDESLVAEMKAHLRAGMATTPQEVALLNSCLQHMGMTPAHRSRVKAAKVEEKQDDPFDKALKALNAARERVQ